MIILYFNNYGKQTVLKLTRREYARMMSNVVMNMSVDTKIDVFTLASIRVVTLSH